MKRAREIMEAGIPLTIKGEDNGMKSGKFSPPKYHSFREQGIKTKALKKAKEDNYMENTKGKLVKLPKGVKHMASYMGEGKGVLRRDK